MAEAQAKAICRWGILGCGGIAAKFVADLLIDPATREAHDVQHIVAGVGSRSLPKAQDFVSRHLSGVSGVEVFGSYSALIASPSVDIIYIATPHSAHFTNAAAALRAGKHVLCEKPLTVNAHEARDLVAIAEESGRFFMEAVWTRFFPLAYSVQQSIASGKVGTVRTCWADLSAPMYPRPERMVSSALAGGSLLDLGPYPILWALLTLYHHPSNGGAAPVLGSSDVALNDVRTVMLKLPRAGAAASAAPEAGGEVAATEDVDTRSSTLDEFTTSVIRFRALGAQAVISANMSVAGDRGVLVQGTRGAIILPEPLIARPTHYILRQYAADGSTVEKEERCDFPIPGGGHGYFWEADECARCTARGDRESKRMPWKESVLVMEILDEIRAQGNLVYPHETAADPVVTPLLNAGFDIHKLARGRPSSALSVMSREDSSPSSSPRMEESGTSLRMQLHELKHVLRQKNALITSLEQRAGGANTAKNGRSSTPSQGITVAPAVLPRRRTSSLGHAGKSSTPGSPGSGLGLQLDAGSSTPKRSPSPALSASSRRRKNAYDGGVSPLSPPISSVNHLDGSGGLETVKEANRSQLPLGEGFLAPTIASENRRIATLNGAASGSPTSPSAAAAAAAAGGGTGKVIHTLTADLQASRAALDATKAQLRASQRSAGSLQRQHDDLKESLARSRLENETTRQMLARKERQVSECLERARKAESEAKELGRASREWGTRVRDVEAELGDVRRAKGKAEAQYEALASSWRDVRESLQAEVGSLREEMKKSTKQHVDEAKKIVQKQDEVHAAWKERDAQRDGLKTLLDEMTAERERFENALKETVGGLVQRLEVHEQNTARQDGTVEEVHSELKRILRLMRAGESSSAATSG